ncbi:MAG: ABC transporter ATP-binding protein [Dehalococcoidia bacterium]
MKHESSAIKITGLTHDYGKREVLKDVNLSIDRGEVFALIGPTGAGKTTLLRIIDLLEIPTSGEICFDGRPAPRSGRHRLEMRRRMSFIHQKPQFFSSSVYDNVACGLRWRGVREDVISNKVGSILQTVGLNGQDNRDAHTLSGGEAQRVALARALVLDPEVLLLDEPTANLDPVSATKIERLIRSIAEQGSTTMIMATHDMSQGQQLADRIGVLIEGRLVQTGDATGIFRSPRSEEVAGFVGMENIIGGTIIANKDGIVTASIAGGPDGVTIEAVSNHPTGKGVHACIRPEDITLAPVTHRSSARNSFQGRVTALASCGPLSRVEIDCGFPLVALITRLSAEELGLEEGISVVADFKATAVHIIERSTDR